MFIINTFFPLNNIFKIDQHVLDLTLGSHSFWAGKLWYLFYPLDVITDIHVRCCIFAIFIWSILIPFYYFSNFSNLFYLSNFLGVNLRWVFLDSIYLALYILHMFNATKIATTFGNFTSNKTSSSSVCFVCFTRVFGLENVRSVGTGRTFPSS